MSDLSKTEQDDEGVSQHSEETSPRVVLVTTPHQPETTSQSASVPQQNAAPAYQPSRRPECRESPRHSTGSQGPKAPLLHNLKALLICYPREVLVHQCSWVNLLRWLAQ